MKIIKQLTILFTIWAFGELMSFLLRSIILIPGSILGMLILFILLNFKVIKMDMIKEVVDFLLENIAFFVIPAGVSLMNYYGLITENLLPILICGIGITFITMTITMKLVDILIEKQKAKEVE